MEKNHKIKSINKIIYFDKETICNILQEMNNGEEISKTDVSSSVSVEGDMKAEGSAKIKLNVPFFSRIAFLFTGKIKTSYITNRNSTISISSTEISEFKKIKPFLTSIRDVQLSDIENSSTSFRVAGSYLKFIKGDIDGLDINQFKIVMDSFDGYDTYRIDDKRYVRFNNEAFVSNYKRNDLLNTTMTLHCICVGQFNKSRFDFINKVESMSDLINTSDMTKTLADLDRFNSKTNNFNEASTNAEKINNKVTLYDVLYASIRVEVNNNG